MKPKLKAAYVIRNGEMVGAADVSHKLRSPRIKGRSLRAARRLGFKNAYAAKMMVNAECVLIGEQRSDIYERKVQS